MSKPIERVEIISGRERRRRYTAQEKGMSRPLLKSVFGVPVIETMRHAGFEQARVAGRTSAGRRGGRRATVGVGFSRREPCAASGRQSPVAARERRHLRLIRISPHGGACLSWIPPPAPAGIKRAAPPPPFFNRDRDTAPRLEALLGIMTLCAPSPPTEPPPRRPTHRHRNSWPAPLSASPSTTPRTASAYCA